MRCGNSPRRYCFKSSVGSKCKFLRWKNLSLHGNKCYEISNTAFRAFYQEETWLDCAMVLGEGRFTIIDGILYAITHKLTHTHHMGCGRAVIFYVRNLRFVWFWGLKSFHILHQMRPWLFRLLSFVRLREPTSLVFTVLKVWKTVAN